MKTLAKTLAIICAVLFVITGVLALFLFTIEQKAFSAKTYKLAFAQQHLYEQMPSILAASIVENENTDPILKGISQEDWEKIITAILPPEELKPLTDEALDSVFDYLNGKTDSAVISLLPFKRHLVGDSGVQAVKQILVTQPDCTAEQLAQIGLNLISGGELILCNPPAGMIDMFAPMMETQLQVMTLGIPDEVTLIKGDQSGTPADPRIGLSRMRAAIKLTPVLPLFFLFGMTLLIVRNFVDWLKWWGVPFIVTGGISFIMALIGSPALNLLVQRALQNQGAGSMPPVLISTMQETLGAVIRQILKPVVIDGLFLVVLGIGMVVAKNYLLRKEKTGTPSR
jgi:hypothetical protein